MSELSAATNPSFLTSACWGAIPRPDFSVCRDLSPPTQIGIHNPGPVMEATLTFEKGYWGDISLVTWGATWGCGGGCQWDQWPHLSLVSTLQTDGSSIWAWPTTNHWCQYSGVIASCRGPDNTAWPHSDLSPAGADISAMQPTCLWWMECASIRPGDVLQRMPNREIIINMIEFHSLQAYIAPKLLLLQPHLHGHTLTSWTFYSQLLCLFGMS